MSDKKKTKRPSGTCTVCGGHTDEVATVYIGTDGRTEGGRVLTSYETLTKSLCDDCAREHHDSDHIRFLLYIGLQICWLSPIQHGFTPLGIFGAAFGAYGLVMLVRALCDLWWHRFRASEPEPKWMADQETAEELRSDCLRDLVKKKYKEQGKHVETIRDYRRRHPEKVEE
ncbi:MAG: hypothetical protein LKI25_00185 [Atopobiaceae bacterium]|jgi:hypothetical protein|nr:hypothetical protein [Atopobiaceae bacterium]MCI2172629.1 hypothetical protein [Atopobiaceae bacterium]MCI2206936.1 hypothetical protein [Atopobiaceae bacterium]